MQNELTTEGVDAQILGVNQVGFESANAAISEGRDIPWLQESADALVWTPWNITYRDVVILDDNNEIFAIYNVTGNNLADPANFAVLKALFVDAAAE